MIRPKMEKDIYDVTLTNEIQSESIPQMGKLNFDAAIDFAKVREHFYEESMIKEGFFVHFEELFCINEASGLIRVSFGANERNEKAYIWIQEDGKASYLPDAILATKSNSAAHTLMKEWFHGICD